MARTPGFFLGAVLTLALGLGAVTTAFGLLAGALGESGGQLSDDRVVLYLTERVNGRDSRARWPYAAVRELTGGAKSFSAIASPALLTACAALSLMLAAVGIYSLTAGWFYSRQKELGVRLALGASPARLVGGVMAGALMQTAIGVVGGVAVALGAGRLMQSLLFGIGPNDPLALSVSAVVMVAVAAIAAWLPARRAFRIDPAEQLRAE